MENSSNYILRQFSSRNLSYSLHALVENDLTTGLLLVSNSRLEIASITVK